MGLIHSLAARFIDRQLYFQKNVFLSSYYMDQDRIEWITGKIESGASEDDLCSILLHDPDLIISVIEHPAVQATVYADLWYHAAVAFNDNEGVTQPVKVGVSLAQSMDADFMIRGPKAISDWMRVIELMPDGVCRRFSNISKGFSESAFLSNGDWGLDGVYHLMRLDPSDQTVERLGGIAQLPEDDQWRLLQKFKKSQLLLKYPSYPVMHKIIDDRQNDFHTTQDANASSPDELKLLPLHPVTKGVLAPSLPLNDSKYGIRAMVSVLQRLVDYPGVMSREQYMTCLRPAVRSLPFGRAYEEDWKAVDHNNVSVIDAVQDIIDVLDQLKDKSFKLANMVSTDIDWLQSKYEKHIAMTMQSMDVNVIQDKRDYDINQDCIL
jgi:hypothetical protein